MKVVTSQTMAKTEKWAFTELDYSPSEWMQLAGTGVASVVERFAEENLLQSAATIIAGKGNNAGDGFVAARILASRGWHLRIALLVKKEDLNSLAAEEAKKCADAGLIIEEISSKQDLIKFASMSNEAVFIDALFGTGFKGEVEGIFVDAIEFLNSLPNPVISIDVPSGMSGTTGPNQKHIIQADLTIAIGLPKAGYFIANGWDYVRRIELVDVLMPMEAIDKMESDLEWFTYAEARTLLPYLKPTRNKYSRGFLGIVAGSKGLYGAAKLTSMGALRAGAGIIKLPYPANASQEMAGMPVEIVGVPLKERPQAQLSSDDTVEIAASLEKADAIVIGPGLSRDAVAGTLIKNLVDRLQGKKFVFDADALNHLADGAFVPPAGSILTPHSGEMMRLLGVTDHDKFLRDFRVLCSEYAKKHQVIVLLKGGPSWIFTGEKTWVVTSGDCGLATAGSGDVLSGVIGALCCQGLSPLDATLVGTWLHGRAGTLAAADFSGHSVIATDIANYIAYAIRNLPGKSRFTYLNQR